MKNDNIPWPQQLYKCNVFQGPVFVTENKWLTLITACVIKTKEQPMIHLQTTLLGTEKTAWM